MNRNSISFLGVTFLLLLMQITAIQAQVNTIADIRATSIEAFKTNNTDKLIGLLSNPVEINLPSEDNTYSKVQASEVLRKFMKANPSKTFTVKQSGKASGGNEFTIGILTTTSGTSYQVYLFFSVVGEKPYLSLIEFEQL